MESARETECVCRIEADGDGDGAGAKPNGKAEVGHSRRGEACRKSRSFYCLCVRDR